MTKFFDSIFKFEIENKLHVHEFNVSGDSYFGKT